MDVTLSFATKCEDIPLLANPSINVEVDILSADSRNVRVTELVVLSNVVEDPIVFTPFVEGLTMESDVDHHLQLPEISVDPDSSRQIYTFFASIVGETPDGTNQCNGNHYIECIV